MHDQEFGIDNKVILRKRFYLKSSLHFDNSVVGVLKSILQIFFGMFVFDRLVINNKTIIGIILSLIGGTLFSYFEYMNKKTKSVLMASEHVTEHDSKPLVMSEGTKLNNNA